MILARPAQGLKNLTWASGLTIFNIMTTENQSNIESLEGKVEELLALSKKLATENGELKQQLQDLKGERSQLVEQKEQVRNQVESMITRLKTIETA